MGLPVPHTWWATWAVHMSLSPFPCHISLVPSLDHGSNLRQHNQSSFSCFSRTMDSTSPYRDVPHGLHSDTCCTWRGASCHETLIFTYYYLYFAYYVIRSRYLVCTWWLGSIVTWWCVTWVTAWYLLIKHVMSHVANEGRTGLTPGHVIDYYI